MRKSSCKNSGGIWRKHSNVSYIVGQFFNVSGLPNTFFKITNATLNKTFIPEKL